MPPNAVNQPSRFEQPKTPVGPEEGQRELRNFGPMRRQRVIAAAPGRRAAIWENEINQRLRGLRIIENDARQNVRDFCTLSLPVHIITNSDQRRVLYNSLQRVVSIGHRTMRQPPILRPVRRNLLPEFENIGRADQVREATIAVGTILTPPYSIEIPVTFPTSETQRQYLQTRLEDTVRAWEQSI